MATDLVGRAVGGYAPHEHLDLTSYAALTGTYGTGVLAAALAARLTGTPLPERVAPGDLALFGVATFKLSRTLAKDKVTRFLRAPFKRYVGEGHAAEVEEEARGEGLRRAVGELLGCPFCLGQWIGTGFVAGLVFAPRVTRLVASLFTVVAVADVLQYADTAIAERVEGED